MTLLISNRNAVVCSLVDLELLKNSVYNSRVLLKLLVLELWGLLCK